MSQPQPPPAKSPYKAIHFSRVTAILSELAGVSARKGLYAGRGNPNMNPSTPFNTTLLRIKAIKEILASFPTNSIDPGLTRSTAQLIFHDECLASCLGVVAGADFKGIESQLLAHFKVRNKYVLGIKTSRRVGKTTSLAIFLFVMAISVDNFTSMVVAPRRDQCKLLIKMITDLANLYYGNVLPPNIKLLKERMVVSRGFGADSVIFMKAADADVSQPLPFLPLPFLFFCSFLYFPRASKVSGSE